MCLDDARSASIISSRQSGEADTAAKKMVRVLPALVVCLTTASAWVVAPPTHSLARTRGAELTRVAAKKAAAEKDSRLWEGDVRRARTRPHHRAARSARLPHLRLSPPPPRPAVGVRRLRIRV